MARVKIIVGVKKKKNPKHYKFIVLLSGEKKKRKTNVRLMNTTEPAFLKV